MKLCNKCGETKELSAFSKCARDGLQARCKACERAYHEANKAEIHTQRAGYREANRADLSAKQVEYQKANAAKVNEKNAAWRVANPQKVAISNATWAKVNPEAGKRRNHIRRARKLGTGGTISKGLEQKLFKLQQGKCACCGQPLTKYHLDHWLPLALGGTNTDGNIQLLLPKCNLQKGAKHPDDFLRRRGFLL